MCCVRSDCGHITLRTFFEVGPKVGPEVVLGQRPLHVPTQNPSSPTIVCSAVGRPCVVFSCVCAPSTSRPPPLRSQRWSICRTKLSSSPSDGSSHKAKQNHLKSVISLFFTTNFLLMDCYITPGAAATELNGFPVLYFRDANRKCGL